MQKENKTQLPRFHRSDDPPAMRFNQRDFAILQAIYDHDGVLARRQIKTMFWFGCSDQAMNTRLSKLYHNGYLNWPDATQRKIHPIPEPIVWIGWRGILHLAGRMGIKAKALKSENENQLRLLQSELRKNGIRWLRQPNWSQLHHDLTAVDFRLAIEQSLRGFTNLTLEQWVLESAFRAEPDNITFNYKGNHGKMYTKKRGVCPDGFFVISDQNRKRNNLPYRARFLLEIDMATHDNPSFGIEKVAAGAAYIQSQAYKDRFGANAGRWLIITTSEIRMKNLMRQTLRMSETSHHLFYFTTIKNTHKENIITDPIWWQVKNDEPQSLPLRKE